MVGKRKARKGKGGHEPAPTPAQTLDSESPTPAEPAEKPPVTGRIRRRAAATPEDLHLAAALIVAHNQARRIAATVRAARAIPGVDLVLVVDDASSDNTQELARRAGAVVVRHSHHRGRTASIETGSSVIAMRDEPGRVPRAILLLPGSLGHFAIGAAPLVPAVTEHVADLAIGLTETSESEQSTSSNAARRAIEKASHWTPRQPLSVVRCLTREALEAAIPLSRGAGLEVGMTLDVLHAGLTATEVECEVHHKSHESRDRSPGARGVQYRDVMLAIGSRRVKTGLTTSRRAILRRRPSEEVADQADTTITEESS